MEKMQIEYMSKLNSHAGLSSAEISLNHDKISRIIPPCDCRMNFHESFKRTSCVNMCTSSAAFSEINQVIENFVPAALKQGCGLFYKTVQLHNKYSLNLKNQIKWHNL